MSPHATRRYFSAALATVVALWTFAPDARAQTEEERSPALAEPVIVLELFTSQGCSSCPQADALLGELAGQPGVVALAFHIDYWDYLGWRDAFADPSHDARQRAYAMTLGARSIYTPQMVVHGAHGLVGHNRMAIEAAIEAHSAGAAMAEIYLMRDGEAATIEVRSLSEEPIGDVEIVLVGYDHPQRVSITAGENGGAEFTYHNVVRDYRALARWDGAEPTQIEATLDLDLAGYAVLVQGVQAGAMVAAAHLEF